MHNFIIWRYGFVELTNLSGDKKQFVRSAKPKQKKRRNGWKRRQARQLFKSISFFCSIRRRHKTFQYCPFRVNVLHCVSAIRQNNKRKKQQKQPGSSPVLTTSQGNCLLFSENEQTKHWLNWKKNTKLLYVERERVNWKMSCLLIKTNNNIMLVKLEWRDAKGKVRINRRRNSERERRYGLNMQQWNNTLKYTPKIIWFWKRYNIIFSSTL